MKRYSKKSKCEKCGGSDVSSSYCNDWLRYHASHQAKHIADEVIHRYCRNCGYAWNEAPLKKSRSQ